MIFFSKCHICVFTLKNYYYDFLKIKRLAFRFLMLQEFDYSFVIYPVTLNQTVRTLPGYIVMHYSAI